MYSWLLAYVLARSLKISSSSEIGYINCSTGVLNKTAVGATQNDLVTLFVGNVAIPTALMAGVMFY